MQVRSKNGKRTVKMYADERRTLERAIELCNEARDFFAGGDTSLCAVRAAQNLELLLQLLTEPEPEVVG